jgi:Spy/CpxP family protein refolding chaperone
MKLRTLVLGSICAVILSVPVLAQNATDQPAAGGHRRAGRGGPADGPRGGAMMVDRQMERLTKDLSLSQDQQDKIRKLITANNDQMHEQMRTQMTPENRTKMQDLHKQIRDAQAAGDTEKAKTLQGQMGELMGTSKREAALKKLQTDIAAVLTDEQKPKFDKIKGEVFEWRPSLEENPEALLRAVESLKLPKDKMDKIKGIVDEWKTKARAAGKTADAKTAKANAAEVYKKVMGELTADQQAKVKAWKPDPMTWRGRGEGRGDGRGEGKGDGTGHKHGGDNAAAENK